MTTTKEPPMVTIADLDAKSKEELVSIAEAAGLDANGQLASRPRDEVLNKVLQFVADQQGLSALGILETMSEGYGFPASEGPPSRLGRRLRIPVPDTPLRPEDWGHGVRPRAPSQGW